ncbi:MAG TPA: M56 family metallopeptidase [Pirellulales bacterium]|nr:M56 family metallopeptidase [Pirellulales bacterium]
MTPLRLLETVCSLSLQVTLLVSAAALLGRYACRSDRARDQLWTASFVALLLLCCGDLALPHLRLLPVPASVVAPAMGMQVAEHAGLLAWLAVVWCAGTTLLLSRLALGIVRAWLLLRRASAISPRDLPQPWGERDVMRASGEEPGGEMAIRFLKTADVLTPFCWQWHRPVIVLPESVLTFSGEEIAAVIRHELAHLSFAHPLSLFVQRLAEAALWFHPAVWWAVRQASAAREFACDTRAARSSSEAAALVRSLLSLAEFDNRRVRSNLASSATGESPTILAARAKKLSRFPSVGSVEGPLHVRFLFLSIACATMLFLWVTMDVSASTRSLWSPWPTWSARVLRSVGITARDYEIDGHRLRLHTPH